MEFLAPWWAALAAAAAVPLLLHLLRKRIGTRVDFPAVRYLERAEQENSARLRLRNWLLMALRVLAVLLIALAAARPVARVGGAGHAPAAVAIVLDNSLSTSAVANGQPVFAGLRDDARKVANGAGADDRLWLVTADGRVVGGDRGVVREAIDRAAPIASAGDLPRATSRAADLVRSSGRTGSVVVLTDGQASAWRGSVSASGVPVVLRVAGGPPPRNRAIVLVDPQPTRWSPSGALVVRVLTTDSVAFRVSQRDATGGDRTLARGTAAGGEQRVQVTPATRGWLSGVVSIAPDELRGDDERWFAAFAGDAPAVTVEPSAGAFVASAVATLAQSGRAATSGAHPAAIVSADAASRLPALLAAPSDASRLGAANLALERLRVPWRFAAARVGDAPVRFADGASDSARVGIVASHRFQLVPTAATRADTLATAGGEPWIVAGAGYVLIASPLVPEATTFPVRAAFVPWLGQLLAERLGGDPGTVSAAAPGAALQPPPGADALVSFDRRRTALGGAGSSAPDRPGVYYWQQGRSVVGALVVNVEPEESVLARTDARTIAGRMHAGAVTVASSPDDATRAAFGGAGRRPIGGMVLFAALLALAAEGLVASRRRALGHATRAAA